MDQCPKCGTSLNTTTLLCPSCSYNLALIQDPVFSPLQKYWALLKEILLNPSHFFRKMSVQGGWSNPLAFALFTHWLGAGLGYLLNSLFFRSSGGFLKKALFIDFLKTDSSFLAGKWDWDLGLFLLDPFLSACSIFYTSLWIFVASRFFISKQVSFESSLRIVCYSIAPAIFAALPGVGPVIFLLWSPLLVILAIKEVHTVSISRAILIGVFPSLILFAIIILGVSVFALGMFKIFSAFFS